MTVSASAHEDLRRAQELLGHAVPGGDVAQVLERALALPVRTLERRKLGKTDQPRKPSRAAKGRGIPAAVRREVTERDGEQCTFVSEAGHRCEARARLEYDHITPVARGGASTVANLRLRCRAHNQPAAERAFGQRFMEEKRVRAKALRTAIDGIVPWLRSMGARPAEARTAAAYTAHMAGAPLEARVRVALMNMGPRGTRVAAT